MLERLLFVFREKEQKLSNFYENSVAFGPGGNPPHQDWKGKVNI
jgi:hypothetical protein